MTSDSIMSIRSPVIVAQGTRSLQDVHEHALPNHESTRSATHSQLNNHVSELHERFRTAGAVAACLLVRKTASAARAWPLDAAAAAAAAAAVVQQQHQMAPA